MNINFKLYIIQRNNEIEKFREITHVLNYILKQYNSHIVISNNSENQKQPF